MTQIEIIQTLEFTKMELETCYKRLGYTSSNVLKALDETIEALSKADVRNRRELFDKFYAWLDGLTQEEYDDMSLTDKCEKFFFKT